MTISMQVLDGGYGKLAVGVRAQLARAVDDSWMSVAAAETDQSGLIEDWGRRHLEFGLYKITLDSDSYFACLGVASAYPEVIIIFRLVDEVNVLHAQIMLAPYAYSVHFGSIAPLPR